MCIRDRWKIQRKMVARWQIGLKFPRDQSFWLLEKGKKSILKFRFPKMLILEGIMLEFCFPPLLLDKKSGILPLEFQERLALWFFSELLEKCKRVENCWNLIPWTGKDFFLPDQFNSMPVSYTHLTLPTILRV